MQAALLPKLAGLIGSGRHADFKAGLRKLLLLVGAVGVLGVVGGVRARADRGEILFGNKFKLDAHGPRAPRGRERPVHPRVDARAGADRAHGPRRATYAWIAGNVAFWIVAVASAHDLFLRVELGFVAGCGIAALVMWLFLDASGSATASPSDALAEFVEQIEHEQLEI